MGAVFALGLLAALLVIAGVILALTGIVILVVRAVKKRKTQKKYTAAKVFGIVFMSLGVLALAGPVILGVYTAAGFITTQAAQERNHRYYSEHEDTAVIISVRENSIHDGSDYIGKTFEYENRLYRETSLHTQYRDAARGSAVANLSDGSYELTVYEYLYPEGCGLLCAGPRIYYTEEYEDKLTEYFNYGCSFEYSYVQHSYNIDTECGISDEMFRGLISGSEKYVREETGESFTWELQFYIKQYADDKRLERTLEVNVGSEGTVKVNSMINPFPLPGGAAYHDIVTDEEAKRLLLDIADKIKEKAWKQ